LWDACRRLEVRSDQAAFVDGPAVSLEEVGRYPGAAPFVIEAGVRIVGFLMAQPLADEPGAWLIWDFLIDRRHQRRGYGRAGMAAMLAHLTERGARRVRLAYLPGNEAARTLYAGLGFVETGVVNEDGECEMVLDVA
jgi:diamine N-acetyltransferase